MTTVTVERTRAVVLLGLAFYAVLVGAALAVLSALNEPVAGKIYRHGLEFGLELIALAWPISLMVPQFQAEVPRSITRRLPPVWSSPDRSYVTSAWIHWGYAVAVSIVFLFPRQFLYPLLDLFKPFPQELVTGAFGLFFLLAVQLLVTAAVLGVLRILTLMVFLGPHLREWRVLGYAVLCGSAAAGAVVGLLSQVGPAGWLRPPATLDTEVLGIAVIAGVAVIVVGDYLGPVSSDTTSEPAPGLDRQPSNRALKIAIVGSAALLWLGIADRIVPGGVLAPRLLIDQAVQETAALAHADFAAMLRRISVRTGFDAVGETFRIQLMDGPTGFRSDRKLLPDGTVLIRVYGRGSPEETRDLVGFSLASTLAELRYWPLQRLHRAGYAYWAAEPANDPFRDPAADWAAWSECDDVPRLDLAAPLNEDLLAPSALPFVLAERTGDVTGAQAMLHDLVGTAAEPEDWRSHLLNLCQTVPRPDGQAPPLRVEVHRRPGGPPADGHYERQLLDEMKRRAALSDAGRDFVIEYTTLPAGSHSVSSFPNSRTIVIQINADLDPEERDHALRLHFVGDIVSVKYASNVDPVRYGYAVWASRDPSNPFTRAQPLPGGLTADALCAQAADRDLLAGTRNDGWLSSVPFIDAEQTGGEQAAQQLLRESLRGPVDLPSWRARITEACGRLRR
jgi:hypothetical protein